MESLNFFKQSKYYVYFVKFKCEYYHTIFFKIGITTELENRLRSLKHEYKIYDEYELLLALQVNSPEIEKDMLVLFNGLFPHLSVNMKINKKQKIECLRYADELIPALSKIREIYTSQLNLHYILERKIKTSKSKKQQYYEVFE